MASFLPRIIYNNSLDSSYLVLKQSVGLKHVSEKEFNDQDLPVIVINKYKCKFSGFTRAHARRILLIVLLGSNETRDSNERKFSKQSHQRLDVRYNIRKTNPESKVFRKLVREVVPEGILSDIGNVATGVQTAINVFKFLGEHRHMMEAAVGSADTMIPRVINILTDGMLLLSEAMEGGMSVHKFARCLIHIARISVGGCKVYRQTTRIVEAQSLESTLSALLLSLTSMALPPKVIEVVKRMSIFTNTKLFDDTSLLLVLCNDLLEYIEQCIGYVIGQPNFGFSTMIRNVFKIGEHYMIIRDIEAYIQRSKVDTRMFLCEDTRLKISQLYDKGEQNATFIEWKKTSATLQVKWRKFVDIYKVAKTYDSSDRVETFAWCFEGQAGTGKTIMMNYLINALGRSVYYHNFKTAMEGKDFYDQYNNEEIFASDDCGSKGPSEYSAFIKLISSAKVPLECAEANKKDTKFFNSKCLIYTANHFSDIHGLSKADNIAEIQALWRRVLVFTFATRLQEDGIYKGTISCKYYDQVRGQWIHDLPPDMIALWERMATGQELQKVFTFSNDVQREECVLWMAMLFGLQERLKEDQFTGNRVESRLKTKVDKMFQEVFSKRREVEPQIGPSTRSIPLGIATVVMHGVEYIKTLFSSSLFTALELFKDYVVKPVFTAAMMNPFLTALLMVCFGCLVTAMFQRKQTPYAQSWERVLQVSEKNKKMSPCVESIKKNFMIFHDDKGGVVNCLVSGHYIVLPLHGVQETEGFATLYATAADMDAENRAIDHMPYRCVYTNVEEDVAILQMDKYTISAFKCMKKYFARSATVKGKWLVAPSVAIPLDGECKTAKEDFCYLINDVMHVIDRQEAITYPYSFKGFCGAMVFDEGLGFLGMHVAGGDTNEGFAKLWSQATVDDIAKVLNDDKYIINNELVVKPRKNFSGQQIDTGISVSTPKETKLVKSRLYEAFPTTRFPVNLTLNGPHTVKDLFKTSMCPVSNIDNSHLKFAERVLTTCFDNFKPLTEQQVVKGTDILSGLAKDTSTGMFSEKDRSAYIDFERGSYTDLLKAEIGDMKKKILTGDITVNDIIEKATLKDELRNEEKGGEPRCFIVLRFVLQVMTKGYVGGAVESIIRNKEFNGIQVGINPYTDFDKLWNKFKGSDKISTDIKSFDKKMPSQVQFMIRNVFLSKFEGSQEDREILSFLLTLLIVAVCVVNDDTYITTHSLPSGSYLTSIVASMVTLSYTAMWYDYELKKKGLQPSVYQFRQFLDPATLGDDLLMAVVRGPDIFNEVTFTAFLKTIGLDATTYDKKPVTQPFQDPLKLEFLKRNFRWHPQLRRFVGCLNKRTMFSGISWVDSTKDILQVEQDKLACFQREAYLHEDYEDMINELEKVCQRRGVPFKRLPESYLYEIFSSNEVPYDDNTWMIKVAEIN